MHGRRSFQNSQANKRKCNRPSTLRCLRARVCVCQSVCVWGVRFVRNHEHRWFQGRKSHCHKKLTGLYPPLCLTLSPHACGHTFFVTHACGHTFFVTHVRACVFRDTFFVTHACQHTFFVTHARACVFILCHPCLCWCMHVKTM